MINRPLHHTTDVFMWIFLRKKSIDFLYIYELALAVKRIDFGSPTGPFYKMQVTGNAIFVWSVGGSGARGFSGRAIIAFGNYVDYC